VKERLSSSGYHKPTSRPPKLSMPIDPDWPPRKAINVLLGDDGEVASVP